MLFISSTSHSPCIMHRGSGENLFTVEKIVCECIVCMWRVCFLRLVCANIHNAHAGLFVFHFCISVPFLFFAFNLNWLNSLFEIPPRRVDARKKKQQNGIRRLCFGVVILRFICIIIISMVDNVEMPFFFLRLRHSIGRARCIRSACTH